MGRRGGWVGGCGWWPWVGFLKSRRRPYQRGVGFTKEQEIAQGNDIRKGSGGGSTGYVFRREGDKEMLTPPLDHEFHERKKGISHRAASP